MVLSTKRKATTALAAATVALLSSADIATAQDGFRQIATDFGDSIPTGVVLPSICIGDYIVPKTMYTFFPGDEDETDVKILTNPEDLIEVGYDGDDGLIYFKFNQDVSEVADDAGIIIRFPPDQLESVNACCSQSVQIKPGFTNVQSITASTNAIVNGTFAVQQESDLMIGVFTGAQVNTKVMGTINKVDVIAKGKAIANIDGNITSLSCSDGSNCKIAGTIQVPGESRADGESTIKTLNCEGIDVGTGSTCESKSPFVRVVTSGNLVISGEKEECVGGEDLNGATKTPTISPAPSVSAVPTVPPTVKLTTKKPVAPPTKAPVTTTLVDSGAFNTAKQGAFASVVLGGAVLLLLLVQ